MDNPSPIIWIVFSVGYEAGVPDGGTVPEERLAEYKLDPLVDWSSGEVILPVRGLPPLLVSLGYTARLSSVSLYVGRSGRELCYLGNFVPTTNGYLRVCLSADTSLDINFCRISTDTRTT